MIYPADSAIHQSFEQLGQGNFAILNKGYAKFAGTHICITRKLRIYNLQLYDALSILGSISKPVTIAPKKKKKTWKVVKQYSNSARSFKKIFEIWKKGITNC